MAGRLPKPWYRADRKCWQVVIDGRRVNLGPDKGEAFRRFHLLMAGESGAGCRPDTSQTGQGVVGPLTFAELVRHYLAELKTRTADSTFKNASSYLAPFVRSFGTVAVDRLRKSHVDDAITQHGKWNVTAEHLARSRLLAVFNWAVRDDRIPKNPLAGLWMPTPRSRGAEVVADPATVRKLIGAAPPYLQDILTALEQTGARPGEVLAVTAAEFDERAAVWVLADHKTAGKTGRPRVVHLTPDVVAICSRLAKLYPSGPLFRTKRGLPFPDNTYLPRKVRELRERLGLPDTVIPYSFRHGFVTGALANGVSDALVAELVGHTSTAMIHRHYSHLGQRSRALKDALGKVRGQPS